jgi:uncharacterized membrane protein
MHRGLLALLLIGCDEPTDVASIPSDAVAASFIDGRDCPPDSSLTYANFGEALLLDHCTGCHGEAVDVGDRAGAPVDVDLTTQTLVQEWLDRVYARSADDNTSMPVVDNMDPDDRVRLGDWLACGAP